MADLADLRHEYGERGLDPDDCPPDPLVLFRVWLDQAIESGLPEPNAMVLASVDAQGQPSARTVLLKGLDEGFVFYTNYTSRKSRELDGGGRAALLFPWHGVGRQVRVEGAVERVAEATSAAYFAARPRGSQLGAWASPQSAVVASREELERRFEEIERRFTDEVPLPPFWGGYRVLPDSLEFWQGRGQRLHDRVSYRRHSQDWTRARLAP